MKRLGLSLLTALVMLCALVGALFLFRPLHTFATFARAEALRALIAPFVVSLQQQVPVTLTVQLPASGETLTLPMLLDVDLRLGLGSALSTTVEVAGVTPVPTVALRTPTPTRVPGDVGTPQRAAPASQPVLSDHGIEVTVLDAWRGEAAWERIQEGSPYNSPAKEGEEYLLVRVRVRNLGDDADATFTVNDSQFQVVGSEGVIYGNTYLTLADPMRADLFGGGGRHEGEVAFPIPQGEEGFVLIYTPAYGESPRYLALMPGGAPPATPTVVPTPGQQTGQPDLSRALSGLDGLDSYRTYSLIAIQGIAGEKRRPVDSWLEAEAEVDQANDAVRIVVRWQGGDFMELDVDEAEYELLRVDGREWLLQDGVALEDSDRMSDIYEMSNLGRDSVSLLADVRRFTLVSASEPLNGVDTAHYTFGLSDLGEPDSIGLGEVERFEGHVWLANDGGYIVRFTIEAEGPGLDTGEPLDGSAEVLYEVYDINEPLTIEPPDTGR